MTIHAVTQCLYMQLDYSALLVFIRPGVGSLIHTQVDPTGSRQSSPPSLRRGRPWAKWSRWASVD